MRNVKIVRMITGEDVICNFIEDEGGTYFMEPLEINLKQTKKGKPTVTLNNWLPIEIITDNLARINPRNIIAVFDVCHSVNEYYNSTMDTINKAILANARMEELEKEGNIEEMNDVMSALMESQDKTLH